MSVWKQFKNDIFYRWKKFTFDPVQVATTSWILQGVTITINPNDTAAIVRDTEPLSRPSCRSIF